MDQVHIRIPQPFRKLTDGAKEVQVEGATLREALEALDRRHSGVLARMLDDQGEVRSFLHLYINQYDMRERTGLDSKVAAGDTISITVAMAGG